MTPLKTKKIQIGYQTARDHRRRGIKTTDRNIPRTCLFCAHQVPTTNARGDGILWCNQLMTRVGEDATCGSWSLELAGYGNG